jgi:DNA segregation ATPase FtsK/SpoIIIE, S-DNA-T family
MEKIEIFNSFLTANKLHGKCIGVVKRGCMNIFDVQIENDFRLSKFSALSKELMLSLKSFSVPSTKFKLDSGLLQVETIVEKAPNSNLVEELSTTQYSKFELPVTLGTSLHANKIAIDIAKNPHMLIGGSTGSGKSTLLHTIISNLLLSTKSNIHIVDTKAIEFSRYSDITPRVQITDRFSEFRNLLLYLIDVMENRYCLLKCYPEINIIDNNLFKPLVLLIDEFADLTMQDSNNECYILLCRLIQKCRAAGIYCILATQRPSVDIITGVIKANFPARIACKVASKVDSRIILDQNGAESLTNIGEAIITNYKYNLEKFQVSYSPIPDIINLLNEKMAPHT